MTRDELLNQLEEYPRRKVTILTRYLCGQLENGRLRCDDVTFNARNLAKHYNISEVTAHKVLEELSKSGPWLERKERAARPSARRSYNIGVRIDSLMSLEQHYNYQEVPFLMERQSAVQRLESQGHNVVILENNMRDSNPNLDSLDAILTKIPPSGELEERLLKKNIPVVICQVGAFEPSRFHSIAPELSHGAMELLNLWKDRKPVIVTGCRTRVGMERIENILYCAELSRWSLDVFQMHMVPPMPGDLGQMAGYKYGLELIQTRKNPRLLVSSDYFSFGLVNAFQEAKWLPKRDYELVSIDNLEGMGQLPFGKPFLSAIDIRLADLYAAGADLVLEIIERKSGSDCLIAHRLPSRFVRRETA